MHSNLSVTEENYVKSIFHLQQHSSIVTTNELAEAVKTTAASVTDMLKKLKDKKLLFYERYKGFKLNSDGKKIALEIIRRHRLWEFFLVEKLQFGWNEVHAVAEELEHVSSKKLIEKLDGYLQNPKYDPHGDPIPDSFGKILIQPQIKLSEVPFNKHAEVISVESQSTELLELLSHRNINIGTRLEVKKKFEFDKSVEIKIKNHSSVTISRQLAQAVFVKIIN